MSLTQYKEELLEETQHEMSRVRKDIATNNRSKNYISRREKILIEAEDAIAKDDVMMMSVAFYGLTQL